MNPTTPTPPSPAPTPVPTDRIMHAFDRLVIHHSASPRSVTFEEIRRIHTAPTDQGGRGFVDIAYHAVIVEDGTVHMGRLLPRLGAHARGFNLDSIGVCVVGDNTRADHAWSEAQKDALRRYVAAVHLALGPQITVCGHRDVGQTLCPGLELAALRSLLGL